MFDTVRTPPRVQTTCIYAGETEPVLYFYVCVECPNHLEVCMPRVGTDGYLHGSECGDAYLCTDCTEVNCVYYQPRYEEREMLSCESI
jgi:hypothetical protein